MPINDQVVRVFISSTFKDMHAERDHLVTVVFPELRERCALLGLEFFDVDLRWGVPEKTVDGETANSWEYCRQWIDRVEPFFICMLGQRYGWVPPAEKLKDERDRHQQTKEPRSVTEMEIRRALLHEPERRHTFFYLRATPAPADATEFVEPTEGLALLETLKSEIRACGRPVRDYPCDWTGSGFTKLQAFGQMVLEDLWSAVLRDERYVSREVWRQVLGTDSQADLRYTDASRAVEPELSKALVALAKPVPKHPLDAEHEQMEAFAATRLRWFQGRVAELQQLTDFINATDDVAPRLAVLAAVPGQGKSALMAKLSQSLPSPSRFIVTHFVGATEKSSNSYAFVKRLVDELDRSGITFPQDEPVEGKPLVEPNLDFNSLCQRLSEYLSGYTGERRIVILIDALNQLTDGHSLTWLPHRLGSSVRFVISCVADVSAALNSPEHRVLYALKSRHPSPVLVPLSGLTTDDIRTIVTSYLHEHCKELDREHVDAICAIPQAANPLYLLVMIAELRTLGGNNMRHIVPALLASLPYERPDTVSLFTWVLERMEAAEGFGKDAVKWWCLYLALGRSGMSSRELADLLARKLGSEAATTSQRIERGLRRYLQRRGEMLDFFHGQLRQAVINRYGSEEDYLIGHREIAVYFFDTANPKRTGAWKMACHHALSELPHHQIKARAWPELAATLENIFFLEAKVSSGMAFDLVHDFDDATAKMPKDHARHRILRLLAEALHRDLAFIHRHREDYPQALFQCLWNSAWWFDCPEAASYYVAPKGGWQGVNPWKNPLHETKLSTLLQRWRTERETEVGTFHWMRALRPPFTHLGTSQIAVLRGHREAVNSVVFSPDGCCVVSGSGDREVRIWDARTGECLSVLCGHKHAVNSVAFAPDGSFIASGSDDQTVHLWDADTGARLAVMLAEYYYVGSVAFSADSGAILSGAYNAGTDANGLQLWDSASGCELLNSAVTPHDWGPINSVGFSPDGLRAVSGADDKSVRVWVVQNLREQFVLRGHEDKVSSVVFSPDGTRVLSGSADATLRLWDANTGKKLAIFRGHKNAVTSVAFSPCGRRIVSGSKDKTIRLWDMPSEKEIGILSMPGKLANWASETLNRVPEAEVLEGHEGEVLSVAFSPDGHFILSGSKDLTVRLWDANGGRKRAALRGGHEERISSLAFSPDGGHAVSGSGGWDSFTDLTVRLWDTQNGKELMLLGRQENAVAGVKYSPDGSTIASWSNSSEDKKVYLWNARRGRIKAFIFGCRLHVLCGHEEAIMTVAFSNDGRSVISGSWDKTVRIWEVQSGRERVVLRGHEDAVYSVALSPDGTRALSGSGDKTVRLWDAQSGVELATLRGHEGKIRCVTFSPDGRNVISGSSDKTVRLWDTGFGRERFVLHGHGDEVMRVVFSFDGTRIFSSAHDNTVRIWDAHSGECLEILRGVTDIDALAVQPNRFPWRAMVRNEETVVEPVTGGSPIARFPDHLRYLTRHPQEAVWIGGVNSQLVLVRLERSGDLVSGLSQTDSDSQAASLILDHK